MEDHNNSPQCSSVHFDTPLPVPDRPKLHPGRYYVPGNMQRHNSLTLYERPRQSRISVRQSLQKKISQFFAKHRPYPDLKYYTSLSDSDLSDTSISDSSLEKLAEAKSVDSGTTDDTALFSFVTTPEDMVAATKTLPLPPFFKQLDPSRKKSGFEVNRITFEFSNGTSYEWVRLRSTNLMDWPDSIKKQIFRKVVVNADKLMICGCKYCKTKAIVADQPSLTQVSRGIRDQALPLFYQDNEFKVPIGHGCDHSVHKWLQAIGYTNYKELHHLELPTLSLDRAVETFKREYGLRPTKNSVVVEAIGWDDGLMGEVEWLVFSFEMPTKPGNEARLVKSARTSATIESASVCGHAQSSIDNDSAHITTTDSTPLSDSSAESVPICPTPPNLELRRPNGEEWGEARWSSAPKLEAHVLSRLASLGRGHIPQRRPFLLRASRMFQSKTLGAVADESDIEDDHDAVYLDAELVELVARLKMSGQM